MRIEHFNSFIVVLGAFISSTVVEADFLSEDKTRIKIEVSTSPRTPLQPSRITSLVQPKLFDTDIEFDDTSIKRRLSDISREAYKKFGPPKDLDDEKFLTQFWALTDRDNPHKLDKTNCESPSPSSCAKKAFYDEEKFAVWRDGRCYYKHTYPGSVLMNHDGQGIGYFNVPFSDIDSPAGIEQARLWTETRKCDMIISDDEIKKAFWCKKYDYSSGTVMLFLINQSSTAVNDRLSIYLSKFYVLDDRDVPNHWYQNNQTSPTIEKCAEQAYLMGSMMAVWKNGHCHYIEAYKTYGTLMLDRDGNMVSNLFHFVTGEEKTGDITIREEWIRNHRCDIIQIVIDQNFYFCENYVKSPGSKILFIKNVN